MDDCAGTTNFCFSPDLARATIETGSARRRRAYPSRRFSPDLARATIETKFLKRPAFALVSGFSPDLARATIETCFRECLI
mgnify:CR=1 FL=1